MNSASGSDLLANSLASPSGCLGLDEQAASPNKAVTNSDEAATRLVFDQARKRWLAGAGERAPDEKVCAFNT
ncbi:MAG: hypothetical protein ACR2JA_11660 [Hydrogenophaga sp.]|uniref:hypothetical protein n=1 Tax=Hydrogenophaga sp. TaxID=1904254 RepID=UPI003D9BD736